MEVQLSTQAVLDHCYRVRVYRQDFQIEGENSRYVTREAIANASAIEQCTIVDMTPTSGGAATRLG
jgi:hypothetical protein